MSAAGWSETDSMVLQVLASTLAGQNREEKAAELLEYVMLRDPGNTQALRALSAVYSLMGEYGRALDTVARYERAVPDVGATDAIRMLKGQALWELGQSEEALKEMHDYLGARAAR